MVNFAPVKNCLLFFLVFLAGTAPAAPIAGTEPPDPEQAFLELRYAYENILGVRLETMNILALYSEIFDWMGVPYAYSGESKSGTDCSGFVSRVMKNVFSVSLSPSSGDIYRHDVTPLKQDELREGD